MITLSGVLALASFIINPVDRHFVLDHVIKPAGHVLSKPFHHREKLNGRRKQTDTR